MQVGLPLVNNCFASNPDTSNHMSVLLRLAASARTFLWALIQELSFGCHHKETPSSSKDLYHSSLNN